MKIETLDFSANCLREFPICYLKQHRLKKLRLIRNRIETIPEEFFESFAAKNIEEFSMNSNPIKELSMGIRNMHKLKTLGISYT